ncbi:hypothetical protein SAMN05421739_103494 [Pontibacter chinhatensis]|uniref:Secreted protein n=1 Tax=Pontibacter chinhatensis TaxID=1436961 RepID=A0A1I2UHD2_9BACT|nr:hypothetical protein SAMN05421739_103494 [Pontibacter chinhatensis]
MKGLRGFYTWAILPSPSLARVCNSCLLWRWVCNPTSLKSYTSAKLLYLSSHTSLATASCNWNRAILTSLRSSSSSHQRLVSSPAFCPPRPGGLAFGHRAAFASCPRTSGCLASSSSPEPLEALNPKAGNRINSRCPCCHLDLRERSV